MTAAAVLATGFLILAVGSGARFAIGLTLQPMAQDFAMGRGMLGIIVAIYFICTAVCMFLAGRLVDRSGVRAVLCAGVLVSAAGIGLVSLASASWHVLVLYGLVFGAGNGLASIAPVSVLVTSQYPGRMGLANGIAISGMAVGQLVMVAAMAAVMVGIGWRSVYVWLGVAHLALLPLFLLLPRGKPTGPTATTSTVDASPLPGLTLAEAVRTRRFWLVLIAQALCGFDDFFVSTHIVAFAQDRGIATFFAGNLLALMGLTSLVGVVWSGLWSDRAGPAWPMLACFLLRIAIFGLILVDQSPLSVTIFAVIFGVTFLMTAPLTVVFVRNWFGVRAVGTLSGLILMIHHICGGIGAWIGGLVFDAHGSYAPAFAAMALSSVIATVLMLGGVIREPTPALKQRPLGGHSGG